ncbi:MAG TPA: hypothetical protein VLU43_18050 [Anaeromyxobacteraceae bacterium]|nr:hypothetical protein [Anaeromyxobacteraceae bacterium]
MSRRLAAAVALALSLPALAYVLPVPAILKRAGARRADLSLDALEVTGTLQAEGDAAARIAAAAGIRAAGARVALPARVDVKVPGRCRLEVAPPDAAEADRPYVSVRDGKVGGRGLDAIPAAVALVRATCALLAVQTSGEADQAYGEALSRRGVALDDAELGRFNGRIAYVIGGRARDARPLAWFDKESFQPVRLQAPEAGALLDVRLLDWGSPIGGDWFPRAVEVWDRDTLRLRFTTEKAAANPKLPDALF